MVAGTFVPSRESVRQGENRRLQDQVIHSYYKNMEPPAGSEGFEAVTKVRFTPGPFVSEAEHRRFFQFLTK